MKSLVDNCRFFGRAFFEQSTSSFCNLLIDFILHFLPSFSHRESLVKLCDSLFKWEQRASRITLDVHGGVYPVLILAEKALPGAKPERSGRGGQLFVR